jgi:hypothetical protein
MSNTPDHSERAHAEFGPSSLKHVHACAGWQSRGGTNEAAEMGTRIHEAVEILNPSALHNEQEVEIYNKLIEDMEGALQYLRDKAGQEPTVHQEIRLEMKLIDCETFGTADIVAVAGTYAVLHDHKTGIGKVDAPPKNWQSKAYAIGVLQQFPEVQTIFASFSLPQRGELLIGEYTRDQLPEYVEEISAVIQAGQRVRPLWTDKTTPDLDNLDISSGCQYCLHRDRCPALGHTAIEIVKRSKPDFLPEGTLISEEIEDLEVLAKLYIIASIIEKWADGIRAKAVAKAKEGFELPGLRLKSMGATKVVVDKQAFYQYVNELGIEKDSILDLVQIPVAKVRDLYAAKAPKGKKTEWSRKFELELEAEEILEKGTERFTLAQD